MHGITSPISFEDTKTLNRVYDLFKKEIIEICRRHNTPNVIQNIIVNNDKNNCELSIVSVGSYIKDSNEEKAILEIISAFNNLW